MTFQSKSFESSQGDDHGRALSKITAIAATETLLDLNGVMRDLLAQHRKKTFSSSDFISAYAQLIEHSKRVGMDFYYRFGTFAPVFTEPRLLATVQAEMAGLMEYGELQKEADLLRSGLLDLPDSHWQLRWHFLMERAIDLGYYWISDDKKFK